MFHACFAQSINAESGHASLPLRVVVPSEHNVYADPGLYTGTSQGVDG
jgi:hypothetical protein